MEDQKKQKIEGAGSLWNVNSWHWEARDYTKEAQKLLTEKILNITLEQDGIKLINKKVSKWSGNAEICIRKQKQIFIYDLEMEVEWFAENDKCEAQGTYKVSEINPDDLDFVIDSVKSSDVTAISKQCEQMIKKTIKKKYDEILSTFVQDFMNVQIQNNPQKLQEDAQKRQENSDAIKKAREQNGDLKQQIFEQQKQKEQQLKEQFSQWNN